MRHLFRVAVMVAAMAAGASSALAAAQTSKAGLYLHGDSGSPAPALPAPGSVLGGATIGDGGNAVLLGGGGTAGYRFTPSFGAGASLSYVPSLSFSGLDGQGFGNQSQADARPFLGMVNGYVDLAAAAGLGWSVQPFVIGGIGLARSDFGNVLAPASAAARTDLAWGAGAGVGIPLGGAFSLDVTYRYLDLGQLRFGTATVGPAGGKGDLQMHSATVGLRLGF